MKTYSYPATEICAPENLHRPGRVSLGVCHEYEWQWTMVRKCGRGALHVNGAEKQAVVVLRAPEYSSDNALQGAVAGVVDLQSTMLVWLELCGT